MNHLPKIDFLDSGRDLTSCCELIQVSEYKYNNECEIYFELAINSNTTLKL